MQILLLLLLDELDDALAVVRCRAASYLPFVVPVPR